MEKDKMIYNPPAWRVCEECSGTGRLEQGRNNYVSCDVCCENNGRIPIRYTPDEWEKSGGVLSDDTPAWFRDVAGGFWHLDTLLGAFNKNDTWGDGVYIIIAIPGQDSPPADWRPE